MNKTFIHTVMAALAAVSLVSAATGCKDKAPEVAALKVEGTTLTAGGTPVSWHGVSFGWHNIWPRFYNAGALSTLRNDWGCSIFRASIGTDGHARIDNPDCHYGYIQEPGFALECLYALIDEAVRTGSYIIVDWHSHNLYTDEAVEFFTRVARRYKGVPNVIYELFNEPVCDSFEREASYADLGNEEAMKAYWKQLKDYAAKVIAAISAEDPSEPLILMGCPSWDQRIDLPAQDPIEGYANLMYTVHFYAATHGQWLRDRCDFALAKGLPLFISECAACEASGDGPMDDAEWQAWTSWADSRGVSLMAWSISDKAETCSMLFPTSTSEGPWDSLKPWGETVKAWIK